jgi:regulator of replication initiation timing
MKQKFTLNIADIQISVVADASPDEVEHIRGLLDRKMREIYVKSRCPKTEAALLCAMEFAADRMNMQSQISELDERCDKYAIVLENMKERHADQVAELERLRSENAVLRSLLTKAQENAASAAEEEEEESVALDPISPAAFFAEVAEAQTQNAALFEATRVTQDESVDELMYEDEAEEDLVEETAAVEPVVETAVAVEVPAPVAEPPAAPAPAPVEETPAKASSVRVELGRSAVKPAGVKAESVSAPVETAKPAEEPTPRPRSRVGNMFRHLSFGDVD